MAKERLVTSCPPAPKTLKFKDSTGAVSTVAVPSELADWFTSVATMLDVAFGARSEAESMRFVTVQELVNSGLLSALLSSGKRLQKSGNLTGTLEVTLPKVTVDNRVMPTPVGLTATPSFKTIILTWNFPDESYYASTEIWRSGTNDLTTAVLHAEVSGKVYADSVGTGVTYYYWVRHVGTNGLKSSFTNVAFATPGKIDGSQEIENLTITNALLAADLSADKITSGELDAGRLGAGTITTDHIYVGSSRVEIDGIHTRIMVTDAYGNVRARIGQLGTGNSDFGIEIYNDQGVMILGSGGNYTGSINGVPAAELTTSAENFSSNNDRNSASIINPSMVGAGTVDHTLHTDGSCDISFEWSWNGVETDIDGFFVYVKNGGKTTPVAKHTFTGATSDSESVYYVTPKRRAYVLQGVPADCYYTFGVQAYRIVDTDVALGGLIVSAIVQPDASGETATYGAYRPTSLVAFSGDVTGTINGTAATIITNTIQNFNLGNDRNGAAIGSPFLSLGEAIDHVLNTDGSCDISFEWIWNGNEADIDGFILYSYDHGTTISSAKTFTGTIDNTVTAQYLPPFSRGFIFQSVAADHYYTFGIQAYRAVDKDINATGYIKSSITKPQAAGETATFGAYRPSSSVSFGGNISGTIDGMALPNFYNKNISIDPVSGVIQNIGTGSGVVVSNQAITVNPTTGTISGIGAGNGTPVANSLVTLQGLNAGSLAYVSKLTSANIANYFDVAAIDSAFIGNLNAAKITTGTLDCGNLYIHNFKADSIMSGTLNCSNIVVKNLNANSITTGTLNCSTINLQNVNATTSIVPGTIVTDSLTDNAVTRIAWYDGYPVNAVFNVNTGYALVYETPSNAKFSLDATSATSGVWIVVEICAYPVSGTAAVLWAVDLKNNGGLVCTLGSGYSTHASGNYIHTATISKVRSRTNNGSYFPASSYYSVSVSGTKNWGTATQMAFIGVNVTILQVKK